MPHLIEVAFRGNRKEFFQWEAETAPALKAGVIVEADRGEDFGRVHSTGELAEVRCRGCAHGCGTTPPPRLAVRLATVDDIARDLTLTEENESARRRAMERVKANHLVMKVTDAEWQWDRRKLTFFFTAERRVDFRALVRDLAAMFRARIELKQIGVRDEAKRLSGIGRCGREYCSASWLPDLRPVNLGVAKEQKLSLNPQQISGACGRLMCCLRYEHEFYVQSRRRFPKEGRILNTKVGEEKVISFDIFNERVTLRSAEGDTRVVPLAELREDVGSFGDTSAPERSATGTDVEDDRDDAVLDHRDAPQTESRRDREAASQSTFVTMRSRVVVPADAAPRIAVPESHEATPPLPAETTATASAALVEGPVVEVPAVEVPVVELPVADSATSEGETRRKRRRGRRGGRRLRAAEQRRLESGNADQGADDAPATDDDDDDDGVDAPSADTSPNN